MYQFSFFHSAKPTLALMMKGWNIAIHFSEPARREISTYELKMKNEK